MILNILVFNARSVLDYQRRAAFSNAVRTKECYRIICLTETGLLAHISDSALFLSSYEIYRNDRPSDSGNTKHGGLLIAKTKNKPTNKMLTDIQDFIVIFFYLKSPMNKCCLYSASETSRYSWMIDQFEELIKHLRLTQLRHNATQIYIVREISFDSTRWPRTLSFSAEEQLIFKRSLRTEFATAPYDPDREKSGCLLLQQTARNQKCKL